MNEMSPVPPEGEGGTLSPADFADKAEKRSSLIADGRFLGIMITGVTVLGSIAFFATVAASGASGQLVRSEESRKQTVEHQQLIATRHKAANAAGGYAVLDAKAGRYKIPVDEAIKMVAKNPSLLAAPVAKAPPTPPADPAASGDAAAPAGGTEAKPAEGKPAEGKPAEGKPAEGKPAEGASKAAADKKADAKPASDDKKPAEKADGAAKKN